MADRISFGNTAHKLYNSSNQYMEENQFIPEQMEALMLEIC